MPENVPKLLGEALRESVDLARKEFTLFRTEMSDNMRTIAMGLVMVIAAAVFAILALIWLTQALVDWLATAVCCTDQGCGRTDPFPVLGSCDADGLRASQLQHAVQDLDGDVHLGRPTLIRVRAQPVPDHALVAPDGGLSSGARVAARDLLPAHPARLGDELQVAVPLRRRGLGRGAGHGGRARGHDDVRARVALGHVGVNALLVVRAVRRDGGDLAVHLV